MNKKTISRNPVLIAGIRQQIRLLDDLISKITSETELKKISWFYDAATRNVEKNLAELRKSFSEEPFPVHPQKNKLNARRAKNL